MPFQLGKIRDAPGGRVEDVDDESNGTVFDELGEGDPSSLSDPDAVNCIMYVPEGRPEVLVASAAALVRLADRPKRPR